jgi:hypothetical protein
MRKCAEFGPAAGNLNTSTTAARRAGSMVRRLAEVRGGLPRQLHVDPLVAARRINDNAKPSPSSTGGSDTAFNCEDHLAFKLFGKPFTVETRWANSAWLLLQRGLGVHTQRR